MCDSDDKVQKWTCDYCTYENYPSSIKCTMCKAAKPFLNEEIYRLSPPHAAFDVEEERGAVADVSNTRIYPQTHNPLASVSSCSKWVCKVCTYLNWPRSLRCVQCCTKRGTTIHIRNADGIATSIATDQNDEDELAMQYNKKKFAQENIDATQLNDQLNVMCLDCNDSDKTLTEDSKKCKDISDSSHSSAALNATTALTSNMINNTNTHNLRAQQNGMLLQQPQNIYVTKWACHLCTYENWPKSLKCSMCGETRDARSNSINAAGEASYILPTTASVATTNVASTTSTNIGCSNKLLISEQDEVQLHKDTVSTNNTLNKKQQNICQLGNK